MPTLSKVAEVVVLLTYIQEVPFSNLGQDTDYPDGLFFVILLILSRQMPG